AYGHHDRHQNAVAILSPMRLPAHRGQPVQHFITPISCSVNSLAIFLAHRFPEAFHSSDDLFPVQDTEPVVLVAQVLPRMPQEQAAVLDVTRREHELNDERRMTNDE